MPKENCMYISEYSGPKLEYAFIRAYLSLTVRIITYAVNSILSLYILTSHCLSAPNEASETQPRNGEHKMFVFIVLAIVLCAWLVFSQSIVRQISELWGRYKFAKTLPGPGFFSIVNNATAESKCLIANRISYSILYNHI